MKRSILVFVSMVAACFIGIGKVQAQEFTIQGDLVSSYVWRGFYQTGVSFQPTLGFGVGDFSLTAWGSTDFDGCLCFGRIRSNFFCCQLVVGRTRSKKVF